jgi:DNA primase
MLLRQGLQCRVVNLPDGEDVDSLLQNQGRAGFEDQLSRAQEGLDFCLRVMSQQGVAREILDWAKSFLNSLQDSTWQAYFLPRIAAGLGLSEAELRRAVSASPASQTRGPRQQTRPGHRDRELLHFAIACPEYCRRLDVLGLDQALATQRGRQLWQKIRDYPRAEIIRHLDEGEKRFYIQSELASIPDERAKDIWKDIEQLLGRIRQEARLEEMRRALKRAQEAGQDQEVERILRAYTQTLGGDS